MLLSVIVLAAGRGKRMHSSLPKVLHPIAGRPMLAHVLDRARALRPAAIHVVYGHGGERVRDAFAQADLDWCLQAEQLGTGHAVASAMPSVPRDHRVLVLCGDVPLIDAATLERLTADPEAAFVLLTARLDDPRGYGRVIRDADSSVRRIVEEKDATEAEHEVREINTGIMLVDAGRLSGWLEALDNDNAQGEYYLTDIVALARADRVAVKAVQAEDAATVLGINDKRQLAFAERLFQSRRADELMQRGATLADPARVDVRGELEIGRDVFIDVDTVLEGRVVLGDGVRIGPGCVVANATLGDATVLHAHTVIDGLEAGAGCELGPYARIRPGTVLAERVKIGNFVEIKNSRVAMGSKINHLSYVGDTDVGRDVNIGAGTITCNYDGAAKHRTRIGDGAFIGSGVMLVAPIEVGAGATIGAGSTLTKAAPPGELTVARSRQTTVGGWRRPQKPTD